MVEAQCVRDFQHRRMGAVETARTLSRGWLLKKQLRNEMARSGRTSRNTLLIFRGWFWQPERIIGKYTSGAKGYSCNGS